MYTRVYSFVSSVTIKYSTMNPVKYCKGLHKKAQLNEYRSHEYYIESVIYGLENLTNH